MTTDNDSVSIQQAPPEIEEPIVYSESSEEEDSGDEVKVKKKNKQTGRFTSSFSFDTNERDTWSQYFITQRFKNKLHDAEADVKVPKQHKAKKVKKEEPMDIDGSDIDDFAGSDDDLVTESENAVDKLHIKKKEITKKERQNKRRKKDKDDTKENNGDSSNQLYFDNGPLTQTDQTFQEMNLSRPLMKAIESMAFNNPTPIQAAAIPVALLGKDICGCAATGTGKTAAFMLPILERLLFKPKLDLVTRVLVLVPTRELGVQVFEVGKNLSKYSHIDLALSVGGLDLRSQEANLRKNPDIVIATPGRLIDHLKNTPTFSLNRIEILVLDEADRMLDEYFAEQMKEIIKQCAKKRQTMLFSATMSNEVQDLVAVSLTDPVKIFVNSNKSIAQNLRQEFVKLKKAEENDREAVLAYLVCRTFHEQCIVFIQTKAQCHRMRVLLSLMEVNVGELHGNLTQLKRLEALEMFKTGEIGVLLCTDLAARGLDIPHVKTVINFTLPGTYQSYVHRVGRTARAGHCGRSISLVGDQEYKALKQIKKSSNTVVYERQPNKGVLQKFKQKIDKLEGKMRDYMRKEKADKEINAMEDTLTGLNKKLERAPENVHKREWFQTHNERLIERKKQTILEKPKKNKNKKDKPPMSDKERRLQREVEIGQKIAKLATRRIGVRGSCRQEGAEAKPKASKKKEVSVFDKELTRTDRKSVKKYRQGLSYQDKKEAFSKKNPGKKYQHKKKS